MTYRTRLLPPDEWPRLFVTNASEIWPYLRPSKHRVIVVEDAAGAIVGSLVLLQAVHAECLWIAPRHRRQVSVGRRLLRALGEQAADLATPTVLAAADTDTMRDILDKMGMRLPMDHYVLCMKGSVCRQ